MKLKKRERLLRLLCADDAQLLLGERFADNYWRWPGFVVNSYLLMIADIMRRDGLRISQSIAISVLTDILIPAPVDALISVGKFMRANADSWSLACSNCLQELRFNFYPEVCIEELYKFEELRIQLETLGVELPIADKELVATAFTMYILNQNNIERSEPENAIQTLLARMGWREGRLGDLYIVGINEICQEALETKEDFRLSILKSIRP
jgi:hypothetical protein